MFKISYVIVKADSLKKQESNDPRDWAPLPVTGYLIDTGYPEPLAVRKASGRKNPWVVDDVNTGVLVHDMSFKTRAQAVKAARGWAAKVHDLATPDMHGNTPYAVYSDLTNRLRIICEYYGCTHLQYQAKEN